MEAPETLEPTVPESAAVCPNCGQQAMAGDYPTPLCKDCRDTFTRFPIPLWIKVFAGGIVALMVFSLTKLPAELSLGIHLKKGEKFAAEKRYMAAERELKLVADRLPGDVESNARLLIAAYYNDHFPVFAGQAAKMGEMKIEDGELSNELDQVFSNASLLLTTDSFKKFTAAHPVLAKTEDSAWAEYFSKNPGDDHARMEYAHQLFFREQYARCDSTVRLVLNNRPGEFRALLLGASTKRELGQFDSALLLNERMLSVNQESVDGLSSEARTLLRMKSDSRALTVALKACDLDPNDLYSQASLILVYHFSGRLRDRDALMEKARREVRDSSDRSMLQYALDVISKKERFRN